MKTIIAVLTLFGAAVVASLLFLHPSFNDEPIEIWNGEAYLENAQLQSEWADRFFFQKYRFRGDEFVLDIGSGDGRLTARIAERAPDGYVVGIDDSESMLSVARRDWGDIDNLTFQLQDAEEESFYQKYEQKFDLVVSFSTLHWIQNQLLVLNGVHDVLKPRGIFYLRLASKGGDPIQDVADEMARSATYQTHFVNFVDPHNRFSPEEYRILLDLAGLQVNSLIDVEEKDELSGRTSLTKQIKSWLPHYHFLKAKEEALAERFLDEVIDRYLSLYPAKPDGTILLYDHYLEVTGVRAI